MQRVLQRKYKLDPPELIQARRLEAMAISLAESSSRGEHVDNNTLSRIIIRLEDLELEAVRDDCLELIHSAKKALWSIEKL